MGTRPGMGGALLAVQRVAGDMACALVFAIGTALSGYALAAHLGASVVAALALRLLDSRSGRA